MIDINLVRNDPELVKKSVASRGVTVSIDDLIALDTEVRALQGACDELRHSLKARSKGKPSDEERVELQKLSEEIKKQDLILSEKIKARDELLLALPNINDPELPLGTDESGNVEVRQGGIKPEFNFTPKPYYELPGVKAQILSEQGTQTSGSRFYYLVDKIALLQKAVFRIVYDKLVTDGFTPVMPPLLVRERAMYGTGHFPADRFEVYSVNPGEDDLYLVGTAEVPLISLHADETLLAATLPRKYMAETTCFRREAGSYGKDQAGILRVHQFQKIEMVAFVDSAAAAQKMHQEILAEEEAIVKLFDLHYRVVDICSGDLGYPAARKFDIEAWFPAQNKYRELTSTSNTTDFQTRRLGINVVAGSERGLAFTVNGTGVTDRLWLTILEQNQQVDGTVKLPNILSKYLGFDTL